MPNRLEMVVRGQRQTALPSTPDFTSRTSPSDGFFMEGTRLSSFELPDHWIPFYAVGLQIVHGTAKRFFFQDGRHHEDVFHTDDMFVIAPQEIRQYRTEIVGGKLRMVSIEPAVLQDLVAGCPSRNPFELTRSWHDRTAPPGPIQGRTFRSPTTACARIYRRVPQPESKRERHSRHCGLE
jgi:hypothetical protein